MPDNIGKRIGLRCLTGLLACAALSNSADAASYNVNSDLDQPDAAPGDGSCASASGVCTLRAALEEANAIPGADTIQLRDGGYYILSHGQLEITDDVTLRGHTTSIDAAQQSRVMQIGPAGWLIADNTDASVHLYTRAGIRKQTFVPGSATFNLVTSIGADGGKVHVLSLQHLRTFDARSGAQLSSVAFPDDIWPSDVIFGPWPGTDNAYVLDYVGGRILRYPTAGGAASTWVAAGSSLVAPNSVIYDSGLDELLVTDTSANKVNRYAIGTGAFLGTLTDQSRGGPLGVTRGLVRRGNELFVVSEAANSVLRYNAQTGAYLGAFIASGAGGLSTPSKLQFGPEGDLYVASGGRNEVERAILRYDGQTGAFRGALLRGGQPGPFTYAYGVGTAPRVELRGIALRGGLETDTGVPAGAIYSTHAQNHVTLVDCLIEGNEARVQGGAIHNLGFMRLERSRVSGNRTATEMGGGVMFSGGGILNGGRLEIDSSTIDRNESVRGGGIANFGGTVVISNSRIEANKAAARGGGILNAGTSADLTLSFSTVFDNDARAGSAAADEPAFGGGIYNSARMTIANSIIAGNRDRRDRRDTLFSGDCFNGGYDGVAGGTAVLTSLGGNLLAIHNTQCPHAGGPSDQRGSAASPLDPRFGTWEEGGLQVDSPAVDSAVTIAAAPAHLRCPAQDISGLNRPVDGNGDGLIRCDRGADERAANPRRSALLVVGNTTLTASDAAIYAHLTAANYSLTVRADSADLSDAGEYFDVVLISESVNSAALPATLAAADVPIVCLEPGFFDELHMTTLEWDVTQGASTGETSLHLPANDVSSPYFGTYTVTASGAKFGWGVPASSDAILIAELTSQPGRWAMFAYDAGASLADGSAAPATRVAGFAADGTAPLLNATGWTLFDVSLDWALR